jgi:hypothetical protein
MAQSEQPEAGWRKFVMEANTATAGFQPGPATETVAPTPLPAGPHVLPQFDPIDRLTHVPAAAEKMRLLGQRSDDQHAIIPEFETVRAASMRKIEAMNALKRLTDHPQDGGFGLKDDDRRVIEATKTVEKTTADFNRLQELQEVRAAAWRAASQAKAACEDFLRHGVPGNCRLEAIETEPPPLKKGEGILDAIEARRRRVRELRADLHRLASAPFPSAYCKQQMRAQIEQLAERGSPSISRLVELDGQVEFETQHLKSMVVAEQRLLAFAETPDALALIAWLHRDTLVKRLDELITSESDDKAALSHEQRQQAEAEVMADLLAIEHEESLFVWQAQSQNLPVEHRSDISPLALLGLRLVTIPRGETPGTTPGYSWPMRR